MSSQLKIEANRRNAQLSTGPKTPEGKAKVATNSCTHGLCSRNAILPEEDPAEFHALLAGLLSEFQPANAREESHVRELASAEWRLRRVVRLETGIFVSAMEKVREYERCRNTAPLPDRTLEEQRYDQNTRLLGLTFRQHCGGEAFTKLSRYENSIRRAHYKALKELKSPPSPRIAKMTEQSQPPQPPDPPPQPRDCLTQAVSPATDFHHRLPEPSAFGTAEAVPRLRDRELSHPICDQPGHCQSRISGRSSPCSEM